MPDQGDRPPCGDVEVDVADDRTARQILERDALEPDLAGPRRQLHRAGAVGDLLRLVHDLEDALARRGRTLGLPDPHAERSQRHHEHSEVEVERHEVADGEASVRHHPGAGEQHARLREQRHERDQRDVEGALPVRLHGLAEDRLGAGVELRLLGGLLREGLDDMDADDVLLGDGRDVGELLLDLAQRRMGNVAVAVREHDENGHDSERDQGEPRLHEEEHDRHGEHGEDVLEQEDEAVPEEEADALQVDRRAGHQLAGLVAVVEAEGEPDELRVEPVSHVHLDAQGLASRDQPATDHQHGLDGAEADDRPDEDPQLARVARPDRTVDDAPGGPDQRDLRGLRADREHDRDDERDAVGAQESEQADERRAIRRRFGCHRSSLASRFRVTDAPGRAPAPRPGGPGWQARSASG